MSELKLIVERGEDNEIQIVGKMTYGDFTCETLELPWKNNATGKSCFPAGEYDCMKRRATTNIPYEHVLILNVPKRDGICIHIVNYVRQLRGCIGVGTNLKDIDGDGQLDLTDSKKAFDKLMKLLPSRFKLIVK